MTSESPECLIRPITLNDTRYLENPIKPYMKSKPTPVDQALEIAAVLLREQQPRVSVEEAEALRALLHGHFESHDSPETLRLANWLLAGRDPKGLFGKASKVPPPVVYTIAAFTTRVGRLEPAQISALYLAAYCSLRSGGQVGKDAELAPPPELKRWFRIALPPDALDNGT